MLALTSRAAAVAAVAKLPSSVLAYVQTRLSSPAKLAPKLRSGLATAWTALPKALLVMFQAELRVLAPQLTAVLAAPPIAPVTLFQVLLAHWPKLARPLPISPGRWSEGVEGQAVAGRRGNWR